MFGIIQEENLAPELVTKFTRTSRRIKESEYFTTYRFGSGLFVIEYEEEQDFLPERNDFGVFIIVEELADSFVRTMLAIKISSVEILDGVPLYVANTVIPKDENGEPTGTIVKPSWVGITPVDVVGFPEGFSLRNGIVPTAIQMGEEALSAESGLMLLRFISQLGEVDLNAKEFTPDVNVKWDSF